MDRKSDDHAPTLTLEEAPKEAERTRKKPRLKLDPELSSDGTHWTIGDANEALLRELREWMADAEPGDRVTIELVHMSDVEFDALPDI